MEFTLFILRWIHFLAGITWIGILYYFNFVQTPFFAETEAPVRSGAVQKLVPRALWWFRWGAMFTFLAGFLMYLIKIHEGGSDYLASSSGLAITIGGTMGTLMFLNVWLGDLARPTGRDRFGRPGCRGWTGHSRGRRTCPQGRTCVKDQHALLHSDALFYGRRQSLFCPRNGRRIGSRVLDC